MKKYSFLLSIIILTWLFSFDLAGYICENSEKFDQPILITSAGQSAEVQLANVLAKRAGLTASLIKTPAENDLEGVNTIILVIGASLKGLGAAGLDVEQEKQRVSRFIQSVEGKKLPIICLHLGGEARRGDLSDELISCYVPRARSVIIVKSGNKDGLFTSLCMENNIPLIEVERTADALTPLKDLFN